MSWICNNCEAENSDNLDICEVCNTHFTKKRFHLVIPPYDETKFISDILKNHPLFSINCSDWRDYKNELDL